MTGDPQVVIDDVRAPVRDRVFGSPRFVRLWLAQVVSATGDWIGLVAIIAVAERVGGESGGAAISLVMAARLVPGFFLGPLVGVVVDRLDRKRVMVACDLGRAAIMCSLPFVDSVLGLVVASLGLEVMTLLWAPAKEASVPNLVPQGHMTTANSLSLAAAYGTFPIGSALFTAMAEIAERIDHHHWANTVRFNDTGLALQADALTFLVSAALIASIDMPRRAQRRSLGSAPGDSSVEPEARTVSAWRELREGWQFIFINPIVRTVNLGLAMGLIGGGMLIPLGSAFTTEVLGGGDAGYGSLITALGFGVAAGVLAVSMLQKHLPKPQVFAWAVVVAGAVLVAAATSSTLLIASPLIFVLGICAGTVYVLGFTLLHENVDDGLRGRIFSALYTLVRLCVLLAMMVGPLLREGFDRLSSGLVDEHVELFGVRVFVPGVRVTLWLAGLIIVGAGVLAVWSLRRGGHTVRPVRVNREVVP